MLRNPGNNKTIKISYIWIILVPLIAKLIRHSNEAFVEYLHFELTISFTWQLLYFSALMFTIANLLYSIRCPDIVKHFASYIDYKNKGHSIHDLISLFRTFLYYYDGKSDAYQNNHLINFLNKIDAKSIYDEVYEQKDPPGHLGLRPSMALNQPGRLAFNKKIAEPVLEKLREKVDIDPSLFSYIYEIEDLSRWWSRLICSIIYGLGLIGIIYVMIANLIEVLITIFGAS